MVAMNVWPTDAAEGSVANEAKWRKMARFWTPSGVLETIGGAMAPTYASPNLTIQSGAAWVDGHYCELTSTQVLTATANGIAVVRFDPAANSAELLWRDGITTPTQNVGGTWEIVIAQNTGGVMADRRELVGPGAGAELALAQVISPVSVTATTAAAAPAIITAPAVIANGTTRIKVEFFCPAVGGNSIAAVTNSYLFDGAVQMGVLCRSNLAANMEVPHYGFVYLTPLAGSHTYSVRGVVSGGTSSYQAGNGAGGAFIYPMVLSVTRA
jgi:hypothetical protein